MPRRQTKGGDLAVTKIIEVVGSSPEGSDAAVDLRRLARANRAHLYPERWRHCLDDGKLAVARALGRVPKHRRAC